MKIIFNLFLQCSKVCKSYSMVMLPLLVPLYLIFNENIFNGNCLFVLRRFFFFLRILISFFSRKTGNKQTDIEDLNHNIPCSIIFIFVKKKCALLEWNIIVSIFAASMLLCTDFNLQFWNGNINKFQQLETMRTSSLRTDPRTDGWSEMQTN